MMTFEGCLSAHCELQSLVKDGREGLCRSWVTTVFLWPRSCLSSEKKPTQDYTFHGHTDTRQNTLR